MTMVHSLNLAIVDDGTLDTVVQCLSCDTQERFNFDPESESESYSDFCNWAIETMASDHVCDDGAD